MTNETAPPKQSRVVVIGGGVVGCSILYHLAKKGWKNLVLLERRELSCGSSWHAAGQFHIINSNANLSALQLHTLKFYPTLEAESEQSIGLHRTGGLYFASTRERMNYLIQEQAKNRTQNPDMQFVDLDEAARLHPLIDKKHFLGALYDPLDGHIDPAGVVQAYAKAARKNGADIFQQTQVIAMQQRGGEWEVEWEKDGDKGIITAEHVVNAGGLWAREVGRMAGLELPILAMEHHYLITEPLEEVESLGRELPAMVDFDGNAYGRQEGMGMLLGTYEENGTPWSLRQTPWDFGHELLPDDLSRIAPRLETAFQHFPKLATAGIKKVVNGPFTFAPDGNALVGPIPGRRHLWSACGVMAGFCQGAGVGKVLADWIVEGEPGLDVFAMDIARFGDFASREYTRQKVIENFGRRFMVAYPNEELPIMRPWQTTPLYTRFAELGAVFGQSFGLEHVKWFSPDKSGEVPTFRRSNAFSHVGEECKAVRQSVGCSEVANFAKHAIIGKDAESFLRRVLAGRMPKIGRMALSPMLSHGGRLLGDLSVAKMAEGNYLLFGSGAAQLAHQRWFAQMRKDDEAVCIENMSKQYMGLALAGPRARDLLSRLTDEDVSAAAFRFMDIRRMEVGGADAIVVRVSFTGELGYEIYCPASSLLSLHNAVCAAGDDLNLRHFGAYALMSLRLEKSFGAWTLDYREDFTAAESGLDRFIDTGRDDYIGAAAIKSASPPLQMRVLLEVDADDADANGDEPIYASVDSDEAIGFITSGGYGHVIDKSLAMGYVQSAVAKEGKTCAVEILGKKYSAVVRITPPYDPSGEKMRG